MLALRRSPWLWIVLATTLGCKPQRSTTQAPEPTAKPPAPAPATQAAEQASGPPLLLRGARVMTATGKVFDRADVLVVGSKIRAVGPSIEAPPDAKVIDASGKVITPGLIDTHSHLGVYAAPALEAHSDGNEVVAPNTAYARAEDGYWPQDPQIDRARAGGVTTMQILPGSANLFGGRTFTVKLYPNVRSAEGARFVGAPAGLKIACGENPKRVYAEKGGPSTRMGNIAGFRDAFQKAAEYRQAKARWTEKQRTAERDRKKAKDDKDGPGEPPAVDFGLETLAGVLAGKVLVHNHCYRADEMLTMLDLAKTYGFRIRSFHHAVEAYKIADALAEHEVAASVWADWWGFKAEAYDGIRENAAMVSEAGARAIIHSDSAIGIQHLNQEAAKAMYAGRRAGLDVSEDEALRWITANPAWALGVEDRVGTIEPGKHADLVVWDGNPFSVYGKVERVFIEGQQVFDRTDPAVVPMSDYELGQPGAKAGAP